MFIGISLRTNSLAVGTKLTRNANVAEYRSRSLYQYRENLYSKDCWPKSRLTLAKRRPSLCPSAMRQHPPNNIPGRIDFHPNKLVEVQTSSHMELFPPKVRFRRFLQLSIVFYCFVCCCGSRAARLICSPLSNASAKCCWISACCGAVAQASWPSTPEQLR